MDNLLLELNALKNMPIAETINTRLKEFESFKIKDDDEWFSELCFCILTANSKAMTALNIQSEIGSKGFRGYCQRDLSRSIKKNKHRFHNNKARFIVKAREHASIKRIITDIVTAQGEAAAREWLVQNVTGLGYKEASHFLRNVGYTNLAILDRHIINLLHEEGIIQEKPKVLSRKNYLEIEAVFNELAFQLEMSPAQLDLFMWYIKTGKVLK